MVEFFVVKGIVRLGNVNLLPRVLDARHLVGHLGRLLNILRICQVPVGPMRRVKGPTYTVQPNRLIGQLLRNLLRNENDRCCTVAWRTYVQTLDRRTDRLGIHHVTHSYLGSELGRRMYNRVSLVLYCLLYDFLLIYTVLLSVLTIF